MAELPPKIVFTYPGQALSDPHKGKIITPGSPADKYFDYGTQILGWHGHDVDLRHICVDSDEPLSGQLENQLATFMTNYTADEQLRDVLGIYPDYVAGHSVGEFSAYTGARVLHLGLALPLVAERAIAMEEAGKGAKEPGSLTVFTRIDPAIVEELASNREAHIGNYNSPDQTTITGTISQLDAIDLDFAEMKLTNPDISRARNTRLENVNVAVHSPIWMKPAAARLEQFIKPRLFEKPARNLILNINGRVAHDGQKIAKLVPTQLLSPVRWQEDMEVAVGLRDHQGGPRQPNADERVIVVEVGYGSVLTGINKYLKSDRVQVVTYEDALDNGLDWDTRAA